MIKKNIKSGLLVLLLLGGSFSFGMDNSEFDGTLSAEGDFPAEGDFLVDLDHNDNDGSQDSAFNFDFLANQPNFYTLPAVNNNEIDQQADGGGHISGAGFLPVPELDGLPPLPMPQFSPAPLFPPASNVISTHHQARQEQYQAHDQAHEKDLTPFWPMPAVRVPSSHEAVDEQQNAQARGEKRKAGDAIVGAEKQQAKHARISMNEQKVKPQQKSSLVCNECGKSFTQNWSLKRHMDIHTGEKPFACEEKDCGKAFVRKDELEKHMRIHTGKKPYQCSFCPRRFTQKSNAAAHMQTHAVFTCEQCGKKVTGKKKLAGHMQTHSQIQEQQAFLFASSVFANDKGAGAADEQKIQSQQESSLVCNVCGKFGKSFAQNGWLKVHMRTHTGEKPFVCKECNTAFSQSNNLTRHKRRKHKEKP